MVMFPKHKRYEDEDYKEFIRNLPCCVFRCGNTNNKGKVDPHHTRAGGMGTKCSDHLIVPLCSLHHAEVHQAGKNTFQGKHNVNFTELQLDLMRQYYER